MKSRSSTRKNTYLRLFVVSILLTLVVGWLLTDFLGTVAEKGFKKECEREAILPQLFLHDNLDDVTSAAKSLAPAEAIVAALASGSSTDLERANRLLDRINNNFEMSVSFLLDRNGLSIASSNRQGRESFVGRSFANRPYFTGAATRGLTTYFALGKVSHERGYYAAVPVIDSFGAMTGVVVVKRNVAPVEEFFKKGHHDDHHVYLVSPEGIVFISSRAEYLFRSLWPVNEKQRQELLTSGQFGSITFAPLLATEPRSGTYVRFENEGHYLQRLPFGSDGWTLIFMDHPQIVANFRLFGILLTTVFTLLLLLFFKVLLDKNKSLETARDLLKARDDWGRTFDTVSDLIAIIDSDYRITSMNRAMAERLGIARKDAVGRHCYELLHGCQAPPPSCPHRRMFDSGRTESEPRFEKELNGDFIVTASPILAADGTIESSVHVMHEITEMKRLNEEVNRISKMESIGLLAGGLAHDFNNVLNVIYGNISFVKMLVKGDAAIVESLTDAEVACERARELGQRLRSLALGNAPVREPIMLPAIIESVSETLFTGSNISHTVTVADDLLTVEADPRQIRQVLENLLTNAKEAMAAGGIVTVHMENYVVDRKNILPVASGNYLRIAIKDSGTGIPEENLLKIFDPYFSTKDTYSQKGLGLGLSICHAILKRHNGHISVESTVGVGTLVTIYLPASGGEERLTKEDW